MKQLNITLLLAVLISMVGVKASAHNIEAKNADGVTIYYVWNIDKTELSVSYCGNEQLPDHYYTPTYYGNVVIPSSVTYNGKEYSVTSIGRDAFYGCSGLTSVKIPNGVTSIGYNAFLHCSGLTSIEIPNSVTSIGNWAFDGCSGLTSIEIPNSVTSIGNNAFSGCSSPTKIVVGSNNTTYDSRENCNAIIETASNTLIAGCQNTIIPNSVTSIGPYAFCGCSGLTSVEIPNSVTSIGFEAFMNCSSLTSVTIPNSVTSIGQDAFRMCSSLTSVTIPNSVTSIGNWAFSGCTGLKKVIVKDIAAWCNIKFTNENNPLYYAHHLYSDENTEITDLVIPNSVTSIGIYAFRGCSGLTSVTIPNSVTNIGDYAFSECSGLTSVTIGNNVPSIDKTTFGGCSNLISVEINSNDILNRNYSSYFSLRNIFGSQVQRYILGNNLEKINDYMFYSCFDLTTVEIPNSVTSIGESAFEMCSGLTSVTIPNSVTSISESAFASCLSLTKIVVASDNTKFDSRDNCNAIIETASNTLIAGCKNTIIPNSVTSIGSSAFHGISLKSVTISSGVLSIGNNAFSHPAKVIWLTNTPPSGYLNAEGTMNYVANDLYTGLKNTTVYPFLSSVFDVDGVKYVPVSPSERTCDAIDCVYDESASNIHIGNNVTYKGVEMTLNEVKPRVCEENPHIKTVLLDYNGDIPANAFYGCTGLQTVTISNQGYIGESAFSGCTGLQKATIGKNVTSIGNKAFYKCTQLQSIDIPDAVKSLGTESFSNCSALESVQIGSNVESIGSGAFASCTSLPTIKIPQSASEISDNAFKGCSGLEEVILEDGKDDSEVLTLGSNGSSPIFSDCPLDTVYIGRNISYSTASNKGYSPFYRNTTLRSVVITDKETEISPNEFYGCTNLKNVRIGDGVTTIGDWAFSGCSSLDYFAFGKSVKTIGKEAFSDCTAMTKLYSSAPTPPVCGTQALDDINKWNCTLTVPVGHIADYQAADQWKDFFFIEEGSAGIHQNRSNNVRPVRQYDINGNRLAAPQHGINIIKSSDGTTKKVLVK